MAVVVYHIQFIRNITGNEIVWQQWSQHIINFIARQRTAIHRTVESTYLYETALQPIEKKKQIENV